MNPIKAVFFEPVGCLAEFRREEFDRAGELPRTGDAATKLVELELAAVEHADLYEDVGPALERLKSLGVAAYLVTSLSRAAAARFVEKHRLVDCFAGSVTRDDAQGVGAKVLQRAIENAGCAPAEIMMLTDTAEGLELAKHAGLNAMLLINDYDEGRALAERQPIGGIVSLTELPDALKLIEQRAGLRVTGQAPRAPFELFDPG